MRKQEILLSLLLGIAVVAVHVHGQMGCADSRWSIPTAVSFVDEGNFDLDEFGPILQARGPAFLEQIGDHHYTVYPFGASVLAAPAIVLLRPLARIAFHLRPSLLDTLQRAQVERGCSPVAGEPVIRLHSWTEQIVASAIVAATTVVVYAIARTELSIVGATLIALLFAFGTSAWSTASRSLWQHGPSMLMLALALLVQLRRFPLVFMGLALAFAYTVRPTNIVPLVAGTIWVAFERRGRIGPYVTGLMIVLVPFFLNNYHVYGTWLSPYYHPGYFAENPFFWDGLRGLLFSPGRGLIVYTPIVLFSLAGVVLKIQRRSFSSLDLSLAACIVVHTIAVARVNTIWWGGFSYGPRFLTDMVPYFMYFLVPVVAWVWQPEGARRRVVAGGLVVTSLISVFIHAQGALNPRATLWNVNPDDIDKNPIRLWDWRHPPFLAGWIADDEGTRTVNTTACDAPPDPPRDFRMVSDSLNMLVGAWTPPSGAVTGYTVESGAASGRSDFPERESRDPTVTAYRVPPGTYYARVRARNACGVSPPSNEIIVTVR